MLFEKPRSVLTLMEDKASLLRLLEAVATSRLEIAPVFECVKVWCKLDKNNTLLFARSKQDVLDGGVGPTDAVSKFKNQAIKHEAYDILCTISECLPK